MSGQSKGGGAEIMSKSLLVLGAGSDLASKVIEKEIFNYDQILAQYYKSEQRIKELQERFGEKIVPIQADFSNMESTEKFVEQLKQYKDIEGILHLAANKIKYNKIHKIEWEVVQEEINVQLRSIWLIINQVMGNMIKRKSGRIVFVLSSCTVNVPPRFLGSYTCCKYALLGLMKGLAAEYAEKGILVNAVSPGMMNTKFLEYIPEFVKEDTMNKNPLKRLTNAEDVLPVIELLLGEANTFITGQNIVISGGE